MSQVEYKELAHLYDLINEEFIPYDLQATYVARLLRAANLRGNRLLDLACATAQHATRLAAAGFAVTGVDLSPALLAQAAARGRARRVQLVCGDIRRLPLLKSFDAAMCLNHTLNYMLADDLARAFHDIAQRLRRGGLFVFDFFDYGPKDEWIAAWRECAIGDGIRVDMTHRQSIDAAGRVATDVHTYEVRESERVSTHVGEDHLRVTHTEEVLAELVSCGFRVLKAGTKQQLGLEPTTKSVAVLAQAV